MASKINLLQSSADLEGGYSQIQKTVFPFTHAKSDHLLNFLQLLKKVAMRNSLILQIISKSQHVVQPQILDIYFFQLPDSAESERAGLWAKHAVFYTCWPENHRVKINPLKSSTYTQLDYHVIFPMYRLVQMTRSGWTVLLAWSRAFTNACFSAVLICMMFLLTGGRLMGWRKTGSKKERQWSVVKVWGERRKSRGKKVLLKINTFFPAPSNKCCLHSPGWCRPVKSWRTW